MEEIEDKEIASLKARQKAVGVTGKKGQKLRKKLGVSIEDVGEEKERLTTLLNQRGERIKSQVTRDARASVKRSIAEKVSDGANPYYLKKREMKKLEVEARYDELKKRGGRKAVMKAVEKKRKKNSQKDKKMLPTRT